MNNLSKMEKDVLSILLDRELYGLEIWDQLNLNRTKEVLFSNLYVVFNRLQKKGFVSWKSGDNPSSLRRKYYKITDAGKLALTTLPITENKVPLRSKIRNFLNNGRNLLRKTL